MTAMLVGGWYSQGTIQQATGFNVSTLLGAPNIHLQQYVMVRPPIFLHVLDIQVTWQYKQ